MSDLILPFLTPIPLSIATYAYTRTLTPIYGSVPTNYHLTILFAVVFFAGSLAPTLLESVPSHRTKFLSNAAALAFASKATYWIAVWTARWRWPVIGPDVTHALVYVPVVWTYAWLAGSSDTAGDIALVLAIPVSSYFGTLWLQGKWVSLGWLNTISDSQLLLALSFASALGFATFLRPTPRTKLQPTKKREGPPKVAKRASPISRQQLVAVAVLPIVYFIVHSLPSPILPHPLKQTFTHPKYRLQILSSEQSTTGLISVGQALPNPSAAAQPDDGHMHSVRYLRADHSILGGVWTHGLAHLLVGPEDKEYLPPLAAADGTILGDSIYGVFVLQEAARLATSADSKALVIGLGAGISTTSLIRHGIPTTIVEIDPAVYHSARNSFGLPDPATGFGSKGTGKGGAVHLTDARGWVANEAQQNPAKFDIIIHDCFSGGGVPEHLYTEKFWRDLKQIANPVDGVLVVNFVGKIESRASSMILYTLESELCNGKYCCRAFHDVMEAGELPREKYATEFLNIVFFCPTSPGRDPLNFREPTSSDYLNSPLRAHILGSLKQREIDLAPVRVWTKGTFMGSDYWDEKYLLVDGKNPLGALQEAHAHYHWGLMRSVLTDIFWETF